MRWLDDITDSMDISLSKLQEIGKELVDIIDFKGWKALIPSALATNSSRSTSLFPCPAGFFSRFQVVIRPFYLTNSTGMD